MHITVIKKNKYKAKVKQDDLGLQQSRILIFYWKMFLNRNKTFTLA